MREKTIKLYEYKELSDEAKEVAVEKLLDINIHYEWHENTYEDAKMVGVIIDSFDIGKGNYCKGIFEQSAFEAANSITKDHGEKCETHQTATNYLSDREKLVEKHSDGVQTDVVHEDNEYEFDQECDELDDEFLRSILEDYRIMLSKEYDYLTSEEAIIETIEANDYEFTENGELSY